MVPMNTFDGFANFATNLGASNSAAQGRYVPRHFSQHEAEQAYDGSTWFGKIVDIRADDATREWRAWKAEQEEIEALEALEKRLLVQSKVNQALKWADIYGGAVLIPDLPGNSASPLREDAVNGWNMRYLTVLHRWQITPEGLIRNPLDVNYGKPERWRVPVTNGLQLTLHPSRVILVNGRSNGFQHDVWGKSLWEHMADSVIASDGAAAALSALMAEAKIDVIGVDDLMDGLASDKYEATLLRRWQIVAQLKSIANISLIDKGDEWSQKQINFAGLPAVVEQLLTIMSGAADIPVTRLLGTSAKGLNSTGEGDLRNYYDGIKAKQDLHIEPQLTPLTEILIRSALKSRPPKVWYDWKPLWVPDEKTRWETEKVRTETFAAALGTGAVDEEVLTKTYLNGAVETGLYPGIEQALADSTNEGQAAGNAGVEPGEETEELTNLTTTDAAPRSLYVSRRLLNANEVLAWARGQGIPDLQDALSLHVTITYSRAELDWFDIGTAWDEEIVIPRGGPRLVEKFNGGAIVLSFSSRMLQWRHEEMREAGASYDFPKYQPHVTLAYNEDFDVSGLEAYQGELRFGPEIFEEARTDGD